MNEALLSVCLEAAVPIWQARLAKDCGPTAETWQRCRDWVDDLIGPGGEDLLFRGKKTAGLFNDLAYCIAVMSFAPGGITLFGTHWKGSPCKMTHLIWADNQKARLHLYCELALQDALDRGDHFLPCEYSSQELRVHKQSIPAYLQPICPDCLKSYWESME